MTALASLSRWSRACPVHGMLRSAGEGSRRTGRRHFSPAEVVAKLPTMASMVLWKGDRVTMAMSGGVDSSVALRILSEFDINLNVVFMRNWDSELSENTPEGQDPTNTLAYSADRSSAQVLSPCGWKRDWEDVQKVCQHVGIPQDRVRMVDFSREYWTRVFEPALNVWENGGTPNPDVACNREIKFGALLGQLPPDPRHFLATGHYARVKRVPHAIRMVRSEDPTKDQTYYLSSITEEQLSRALFPLGTLKKEEVKKLAKYYGLPTAEKEESMGLCFVGERNKFGTFISQYMPKPKVQGYLVDAEGKQLAKHDGLWHYTVGQGAKIGGMEEQMFVSKKNVGETGQDILVVPGNDNPALLCTRIHTHDFHWLHNKTPKGIVPGGRHVAFVQLRHKMEPVRAVISHSWDGQGLQMDFPTPIHGVAPGQVVALYYNIWCLGSGVIKSTVCSDVLPARRLRDLKSEEHYSGATDALTELQKIQEKEEDTLRASARPIQGTPLLEEAQRDRQARRKLQKVRDIYKSSGPAAVSNAKYGSLREGWGSEPEQPPHMNHPPRSPVEYGFDKSGRPLPDDQPRHVPRAASDDWDPQGNRSGPFPSERSMGLPPPVYPPTDFGIARKPQKPRLSWDSRQSGSAQDADESDGGQFLRDIFSTGPGPRGYVNRREPGGPFGNHESRQGRFGNHAGKPRPSNRRSAPGTGFGLKG